MGHSKGTHPQQDINAGTDQESLQLLNSVETNGLGTIVADHDTSTTSFASTRIAPTPARASSSSAAAAATAARTGTTTLPPTSNQLSSSSDQASIWQQSSHPIALLFLFLFRSMAITTYLLCGFFSDSYVFSTVIVVILLSIDFWTVRNISGRVLVGLRFWNQVDEDGSSYWVFESRDPSQAANPVDSKMFWMALYAFPLAWIFLLFIGILKFNLSFLPIVILALVFNLTNTIGFTYADRDSKRKWASQLGSNGLNGLLGHVGGGLLGGLTRVGLGKLFG